MCGPLKRLMQTSHLGESIDGHIFSKYAPFTFCKYDEHIYKLPEGYKPIFILVN